MINRALPSISYSTLLDIYQILGIVFICFKAAWHALEYTTFFKHNIDHYSLILFIISFILKHVYFFIWVYRINRKKRELIVEEVNYFAKHKEYFLHDSFLYDEHKKKIGEMKNEKPVFYKIKI